MSNQGKGRQHANVLKPSTQDTIQLGIAVEERFLQVCEYHLRLYHTKVNVPSSLDGALLRWRTMRVHHKKGDFRNTREELQATREIADWTLSMQAMFTNTQKKTVNWSS